MEGYRSPCKTRTNAFSSAKINLASTGSPPIPPADPTLGPMPMPVLDVDDPGNPEEDVEAGKRSAGSGSGRLRLRKI